MRKMKKNITDVSLWASSKTTSWCSQSKLVRRRRLSAILEADQTEKEFGGQRSHFTHGFTPTILSQVLLSFLASFLLSFFLHLMVSLLHLFVPFLLSFFPPFRVSLLPFLVKSSSFPAQFPYSSHGFTPTILSQLLLLSFLVSFSLLWFHSYHSLSSPPLLSFFPPL